MALIASLFALAGRFVGRVLTTTLGWASVLLFGRIPQDRQVWLAVLTFGSLAWVAAVVGILVPDVGAVLLTALPLPDWVPEDLVRLAMLATALVLPAVLGGVTLLLFDPEDRPKGTELLVQVARGYALVPILAVTLVVLAVAGTVRKLDSLAHRREDAHVPIVVRPGRYDALVATLEDTLRAGGLVEGRRAGSTVLTTPARLLARVAGRGHRLARARPAHRAPRSKRCAVGLPGRPRADRLEGRGRPGSRPGGPRRAVEGRLVHDDEGGPEGRGSAGRARIGGPGDSGGPAARDRSRPAEPDDRPGHLRGALPAPPAAGGRPRARRPRRGRAQPPPPEPAGPAPRWRLSLGSVVGLVVAALTAIDLALVALRDRLPRRAR